MLKVLNLYAGIGGNRKLWTNCEVTAVEYDQDIAFVYKELYPDDTVIVGDAHKYLEEHYKEFDFIWSNPPCQSHSSFRHNICVRFRGTKAVYPDMKLWQEILFLKHHCKTIWVVENVKPYYKPLIEPTTILARHLFWSNLEISQREFDKDKLRSSQIKDLQDKYSIDLTKYKLKNKRQILRNCVDPDVGLHIFNALKEVK